MLTIDGVKIDFIKYKYALLNPVKIEDNIRLVSAEDIAAMKISAIVGRGAKKDFFDLYFLLKDYSIQEILDFYDQKFPDGNRFMVYQSLVYFQDAEEDPDPIMIEKVSWDQVKESIQKQMKGII